MGASYFIGTAGWSIQSRYVDEFPSTGSHLERYAARLDAVEINSSFYRPHRRETYQRWAASVPPSFRFAVKLPKAITHERRLADSDGPAADFLSQVSGLGEKLAVILVQLPPSLRFDAGKAEVFFHTLRGSTKVGIACEARHATWFDPQAEALLAGFRVARVAADPSPHVDAARPAGWQDLAYFRLHGSPKIYFSDYSPAALTQIKASLKASKAEQIWCIFDNTAHGHALGNALTVAADLAKVQAAALPLR